MNFMILILCVIWGFNFVIMKQANTEFPPVLFAAYRFMLGALVLFVIAYYKRVLIPNKRDVKWLQTAFFNMAIQISLNYISAGLTSVLTYSMPLWFTIAAHFFIPGEKLSLRKMIGIFLGIIGLFLAMDVHLAGDMRFVILALLSGVIWAIANLIVKVKLQHVNNLQFTTWQMAIGAVGLLLYALIFEDVTAVHWSMMSGVYLIFSGVIASSFAFVLWFHILSKTEASKASISLLLVPIIGVISGCLVLHEKLQITTTAGIIFVIAGIWIVNLKSTKAASVKEIV
jgi:O-acetylserine/cysteine efflux transporter